MDFSCSNCSVTLTGSGSSSVGSFRKVISSSIRVQRLEFPGGYLATDRTTSCIASVDCSTASTLFRMLLRGGGGGGSLLKIFFSQDIAFSEMLTLCVTVDLTL